MFFFFKQKTAYEMRISDWSSDVCSSDLLLLLELDDQRLEAADRCRHPVTRSERHERAKGPGQDQVTLAQRIAEATRLHGEPAERLERIAQAGRAVAGRPLLAVDGERHRQRRGEIGRAHV